MDIDTEKDEENPIEVEVATLLENGEQVIKKILIYPKDA